MNDIYEKLEQINIIELYSIFDHDREVKKFIGEKGKEYHENGDDEKAKICQIEIDTLNFTTKSDAISYTFAGTDSEGNPFEYPNIKLFNDEDFVYLIKRLGETNNEYLKARYSHVLWHSPKKHLDYAKTASESYLEIAKLLYQEIDESDSKSLGIHVINTLENAILISSRLKDKSIFESAKSFLLQVVCDFSHKDKLYVNTSLLFFMLDQNKFFKRDDLQGLETEIYQIAQGEDDFRKIDILQLGKKIDIKLGNNNLYWDKEIAEYYESMSYKREDDTNLVSTQFAQEAAKYYKLAKEEEKTQELTKRYQHLKENMKLGKFSTKIDLTEIMDFVRKFSDEVSSKKIEEILPILMYDRNILPSYNELEKQAKEQKKNHPMQFLATTSVIDNNGHVSEYFSTDEESMYHAILQNFDFSLQFCRSHLLREIFFKGVLKGNITTSDFIQFMRGKTWLGQNITRTFKQGEQEVYNWLNLIMPSINDYLVQLHFYLTNQNNHLNFVLCIDSLAVKIEGILRDMVNMGGGTSFFFTPDKAGRSVAREKDINALFHEDVIKNLISKDDLLFLKYLLVEKSGLNLRNKVSHSLFRHAQNYSIDYMNLLIIAVLRLAKNEYYPLKEEDDTAANKG